MDHCISCPLLCSPPVVWCVLRRLQGLSEVENLAVVLPFVRNMDDYVTSLVTAYMPVILLLILINTLYFILKVRDA